MVQTGLEGFKAGEHQQIGGLRDKFSRDLLKMTRFLPEALVTHNNFENEKH